MFENYKDVLTVEETCQALSMGKNTVYQLLKTGRIKSIKIGRKYFVPKVCITDFVDSMICNNAT